MRTGILSSLTLWIAGSSWALGQAVPPVSLPVVSPPTFASTSVSDAGTSPAAPLVPTETASASAAAEPTVADPEPTCLPDPVPCQPCPPKQKKCPPGMVWASIDYILWWVEEAPIAIPLVTTGPPASLGILGNFGTRVIFGNEDLDYSVISGGRISLGVSNREHTLGLFGTVFMLEDKSATFTPTSNPEGLPLLARPFINAVTGLETSLISAAPGTASGGVNMGTDLFLWGAEANGVVQIYSDVMFSLDGLLGFQFLDLEEKLRMHSDFNLAPGNSQSFFGQTFSFPAAFQVHDAFHTKNYFYGGQVGVLTELRCNRFYSTFTARCGIGSTHQTLTINGTSRVAGNGQILSVPGGLLAVASNIGREDRNFFTVVPRGEVNVGYELTRWMRVYVGYTFIYWSSVIRPGMQLDRVVNLAQVPLSQFYGGEVDPIRPRSMFNPTDIWIQGVNFGLAVRY
ncbi:MAG: BBP7 family outer membrane beta-barrel protein [Gemmataceae bacterium]|nr:BBP7 family outer membrane beta-barrel protein [Gemmataceae bacterium]MDW8264224.1 BBP7 family outer membrane beta-barrel protein [Gemmataceae bacterium]